MPTFNKILALMLILTLFCVYMVQNSIDTAILNTASQRPTPRSSVLCNISSRFLPSSSTGEQDFRFLFRVSYFTIVIERCV